MNDTTKQVGPPDTGDSGPSREEQQHKSFATTRKVARVLLAVDSWKSQASILRHRASFPLLRRVISLQREQANRCHALADLPDVILEKSKLGHAAILVVAVPAFLWSLIVLTKGIAAMTRFGVPFNSWLLMGVPLAVYTGVRCWISYRSYQLFSGELAGRSRTDGSEAT